MVSMTLDHVQVELTMGQGANNPFFSNHSIAGAWPDPIPLSTTEDITIYHWRARVMVPKDLCYREYAETTMVGAYVGKASMMSPLIDLVEAPLMPDGRAVPLLEVPRGEPLLIHVYSQRIACEPIEKFAKIAETAVDAGHGRGDCVPGGLRYHVRLHIEGVARTA